MSAIEKEGATTMLHVTPFEVISDRGRCGSIDITLLRKCMIQTAVTRLKKYLSGVDEEGQVRAIMYRKA
jgi:hypothetical protein